MTTGAIVVTLALTAGVAIVAAFVVAAGWLIETIDEEQERIDRE